MEENSTKICPKCGAKNDIKAFYCSNCAYDFIEEKPKKKKSKALLIAIAIIFFIGGLLFTSALYIKSYLDKQQAILDAEINDENFYHNCVMGTYEMIDGAAEAEACCNEIIDVWHDCIWQEYDEDTVEYTKDDYGNFFSDFNDALNKYSSSDKYKDHVSKIQKNQEVVKGYLSEARKLDIPSNYAKMYDHVEELYDLYIEFTNLPIRMSGSYNSFSEDFTNIDDDFIKQYDITKAYFDKQ